MDIDFEALRQPVDAEGGLGPDLSDDPGFAQFEVDIEGFLPTRADDFYYAFRSPNPDLDRFTKRCLDLLAGSRDLRLIISLAKLAALSGNTAAAAGAVGLVRHFLEESWDNVHPQALSGTYNLRGATVERLDEFASFVLPLQYAPLVSDRSGHVCYRDHAVATGAVIAREEDSEVSLADIERTLSRCEMTNLVTGRDLALGLKQDLAAIGLVWAGNAVDPPSLAFKRLAPMLDKMSLIMEEAVTRRDPSLAHGAAAAAEPEGGETAEGDPHTAGAPAASAAAAPAASTGGIANLTDARAALHAASHYFERREPSSPAFLLARKAEGLVGLTFPQVLQQLAPDRVYDTAIQLGGKRNITLPLEKLTEEFGAMDLDRGDEPEATQNFEAPDRGSALALMGEVAKWYRTHEPSNPIPLLLDKAREMTAKDFAALLSDIAIPEE